MKKHLNNFPEHSISIESYYDLLSPCNDSRMLSLQGLSRS